MKAFFVLRFSTITSFTMKDYKNLDVWEHGLKTTRLVYESTRNFPNGEKFGLTNQMRRAGVSVMSNIAEGCGRRHQKDRLQFFYISRGSLYELESQLIIARELGYIGVSTFEVTNMNVQKTKMILNGFIAYQRNLKYPTE